MSENKKILWDNAYSLGIKQIDHQHKKLFDLVNELYDLEENGNIKEQIRKILYAFHDYTKVHFKDEEDYIASINFPDLENHKIIHKTIIESLSNIIHTPASLSIIKTKMRVVAKRVLIEHIVHEDSKIKTFQDASGVINEKIYKLPDV
jgi:hemerythrin